MTMLLPVLAFLFGSLLIAAAALAFGSSFTGSFIFATDRFADQIDSYRQPSLIIASPK